MKKLWVALIFVLVLGLGSMAGAEECEHFGEWVTLHNEYYHWSACADCGEEFDDYYGHYSYCNTPTTCIECEATNIVPEEIEHDYDTDAHDDTHCWWECVLCGDVYSKSVHKASCRWPDECIYCGQTDVTIAAFYNHAEQYLDTEYKPISDTQCQLCCEDCGLGFAEPVRHVAYCWSKEKCYRCGYTACVDAKVDGHDDRGEYIVICDEPDTCLECGATEIIVDTVRHAGSWEWSYNDTKHFYECSGCGAQKADEYYIEEHFSTCDAPTVCWNCSYIGPNCKVLHAYTNFDDGFISFVGPLLSDANGHWRVCPDCGDKTAKSHTFGSNNLCTECGYERQTAVCIPGDADNSAGISLADAVAVLQYCVSASTSINTSNADVTGDGKVDEKDALLIL